MKSSFLITFQYSDSIIIDLVYDTTGPTVKFSEPSIDFGIIRSLFIKQITFKIENQSNCVAPVVLQVFDPECTQNYEKSLRKQL